MNVHYFSVVISIRCRSQKIIKTVHRPICLLFLSKSVTFFHLIFRNVILKYALFGNETKTVF